MATPPESKNLELSVTNFGPIARANIDLRPMTVFVGPSNTGKSYLAILIYALHRFFGGKALDPGLGALFGSRSIFGNWHRTEDLGSITDEVIDALIGWVNDRSNEAEGMSRTKGTKTQLPDAIAEAVRDRLADTCGLGQIIDNEIARCFGIDDARSLVRHGVKDGMKVVAKRPVAGVELDAKDVKYKYTRRNDKPELAALVPSTTPLRVPSTYIDRLTAFRMGIDAFSDKENRAYWAHFVLRDLADQCGSDSFSPLTRTPYYLPADRTGIMHAHRVIVGSIIGQASRAGFQRDTPLPRLSGVLADFLEQLIGLGGPQGGGRKGPTGSLAQQIEKDILGGDISMSASLVGYPEFFYRPEGWKATLGLMSTSSMVSELAPVVLYLRHVVQPGETLIIEEPESHLHPAMQVEFIRQLAAVANAGVRVIITTHSEWVLDELANLVRLGALPKSRREGISGADFALSPEMLGVWLFKPKKRPKGSVVEEIPFDENFGGFRSGFDEVAMGTYNDYATISNRIEEKRAGYKSS